MNITLNTIWRVCEALEHFTLIKIFILQDASKSIQISAFHVFKVITCLFSYHFRFSENCLLFKNTFHHEKQIGVQKSANNFVVISIYIFFNNGLFLLLRFDLFSGLRLFLGMTARWTRSVSDIAPPCLLGSTCSALLIYALN